MIAISHSRPTMRRHPRQAFAPRFAGARQVKTIQPQFASSLELVSPYLAEFEKEVDLNAIFAQFDFSRILLPGEPPPPNQRPKGPDLEQPAKAWRPVMSAQDAAEWAKDSADQRELTHYTSKWRAFWIRRFGFKMKKFDNGSGAGAGIYFANPGTTAKETGATRTGSAVKVRVNVKNPARCGSLYPLSEFITRNITGKVMDFGDKRRISYKSRDRLLHEIERQLFVRAGYDALIAEYQMVGTVIFDPKKIVVIT